MKNTMFAENINEKVKSLRKALDEFYMCLEPDPVKTENASDLEKVHTLYVLRVAGELVESILVAEFLIDECSEEDFKKTITDDGAKTIEEVKKELMLSMAVEALSKKFESEED